MDNHHILRIPSVEPYGYVEVTFTGTAEDAIEEQKRLANLFKESVGLPPSEWRDVLDHYLSGKPFVGDGIMEQIGRMSSEQKFCMNEIKKSRARTK